MGIKKNRRAVQFRKNRKINEFREEYRNLAVILLDDIQLLEGRKKSQTEFISIYNEFYDSGKQIVIAGTQPPSQIQNLLPQVRSRLEWGPIVEIQAPDQKTKIIIIKKWAKNENLKLPDDVIFFLANSTNLGEISTPSSIYSRFWSLRPASRLPAERRQCRVGRHSPARRSRRWTHRPR